MLKPKSERKIRSNASMQLQKWIVPLFLVCIYTFNVAFLVHTVRAEIKRVQRPFTLFEIFVYSAIVFVVGTLQIHVIVKYGAKLYHELQMNSSFNFFRRCKPSL